MAWKYKDLVDAGREDTIREVTYEEMLNGLQPGYEAAERYSPYSPESTAGRGDWGVADNAFMNDEDWQYTKSQQAEWFDNDALRKQALAAGNTELADYYLGLQNQNHENVQQRRYKYGYSGGVDGSEYNTIVANTAGLPGMGSNGGGADNTGASGYMSQYQSRIDALLNGILNREAFSYNKDTDPLYQQYKESYTRAGNRAMQDTLAQMSARTGGLASSYAGSASQQTYNNYMAQLADKVPELYQLAYSMYQDDLANDRADLNTLLGIDDTHYGRYRDTVGDQQWQQQFDYNAYRDLVGDSQWQQSFDYNASRDQVSDSQWQQQFDYGVTGDKQKLAQSQVDAILSAGGTPSAELLAQAGYSDEYAAALGMYYQQQAALAASKGSGSSGGSKNGGTSMSLTTAKQAASNGVFNDTVLSVLRKNGYDDEMLAAIYGYDPNGGAAGNNGGNGNIVEDASYTTVPGFGRVTWQELESMVDRGEVIETYDESTGKYTYRKNRNYSS